MFNPSNFWGSLQSRASLQGIKGAAAPGLNPERWLFFGGMRTLYVCGSLCVRLLMGFILLPAS